MLVPAFSWVNPRFHDFWLTQVFNWFAGSWTANAQNRADNGSRLVV